VAEIFDGSYVRTRCVVQVSLDESGRNDALILDTPQGHRLTIDERFRFGDGCRF
jgi:hypothetical protein